MGWVIPVVRHAVPRDARETLLHQVGQRFFVEQMRPEKTKITKRAEKPLRYAMLGDQRLRVADLACRVAWFSAITDCKAQVASTSHLKGRGPGRLRYLNHHISSSVSIGGVHGSNDGGPRKQRLFPTNDHAACQDVPIACAVPCSTPVAL